MNLSEVIKENLKNKGLKQSFLSKQLNISDQLLSHKLSNNTLRTDELFKIAKILGINLNKFKEA
ncbi:helix-turn-helix transcriptional regulator [bacterium]|nr:helix-turn-helix transcriptional regulator [bacterium]